jgi:hypothetical protein
MTGAKPPRVPQHFDPESRAVWRSWTGSELAPHLTELDWTALLRNVSSDQERRMHGMMRADLARVLNAEYERLRKLAEARKAAAQALVERPRTLPDDLSEHLALAEYALRLTGCDHCQDHPAREKLGEALAEALRIVYEHRSGKPA